MTPKQLFQGGDGFGTLICSFKTLDVNCFGQVHTHYRKLVESYNEISKNFDIGMNIFEKTNDSLFNVNAKVSAWCSETLAMKVQL